QGLSSVSKRDFLRLFWPAYCKAFTKENITSAWSKTGIHPFNPAVILKLVEPAPAPLTESSRLQSSSNGSHLSAPQWRIARALQALVYKKKRRKRSKHLFEDLRAQDGQGSTFYSPMKIQQAKDYLVKKEQAKVAVAEQKRLEADARVLQKQLQQRAAAEKKEARQQQQQARAAAAAVEVRRKSVTKEVNQSNRQLLHELQHSVKRPRRPLQQARIATLPLLPVIAT
ncbi:hypothetical protein BAUCODRAFT_75417, partial [Baudoinia panamericana UAMH 10762]